MPKHNRYFRVGDRMPSKGIARIKNAPGKGIKPPKMIPKRYTKPKGYTHAENEQNQV